jgi:hypothetical protein
VPCALSGTGSTARYPALVFSERLDEIFQLFGRGMVEVNELHTDLKQVLCKSFGMNNPCAGPYSGSRFVFLMQAEMNVNVNIQHYPKRGLIIRENIANRLQVAAELYTATGQVMNQGNLHLTTGRPDFTGNFRLDSKTFPVTAQVLARFFTEVYRYHDIYTKKAD